MNKIRLEALTEHGIDEQIEVGAAVYATPEVTDKGHLRWKHLANPSGSSISVSARNADGVLVGRSFLQPRRLMLGTTASCSGATVTDLVVKPEERNAATMVAMTRAIRAPEGFDVVFHTSNEVSDVFYRKLFKFRVAFSLRAAGLPLGVAGALKRILPSDYLVSFGNFLASPWRLLIRAMATIASSAKKLGFGLPPDPEERTALFQCFREYAGPHLERDQSFLQWRFAEGPLFRAEVKWVWLKNECLGYLAFKQVELAGLKIMVIVDSVLSRPLSFGERVTLKLIAARTAANARCDAIFTIANITNSALKWMDGFPFLRIPDKYLPHPTPIFVHASRENLRLMECEDLFFSLADLDYF